MISKTRTQKLEQAAIEIVEAFGIERLDQMQGDARRVALRQMYHELEAAQDCHYDTAKRHIARACRRLRHPDYTPPKWGGQRQNAGRPSHSDDMRLLVEQFISSGGEAIIGDNYVVFGGRDADGERIPLDELQYSTELGFYHKKGDE